MNELLFNKALRSDGITLMEQIDERSVKCAFFDPQYRSILDAMQYGNEGVRQRERCSLKQMEDAQIAGFVHEIDRVLVPSGHLFFWMDKFILCKGFMRFVESTDLITVDLLTWDKLRIGMGYRTRRRCEYLAVLQKPPKCAKKAWHSHSIPDVWQEKVDNIRHPHIKPIELEKQLILAVTETEEDIVLDPCAGSFSVLKACAETKRVFIGGDIEFGDVEM